MYGIKFVLTRRLRQAAYCGVVALIVSVCVGAHHKHHWLQAPVISGTPPSSDVVGQMYTFTPTASDPSGYPLTFAIVGKPAWASFNASTGQLAGVPTAASVGVYSNIVISVSDGVASASLLPFSISVSALPNVAPTISGQPVTSLNVGSTYGFTPTAADADGDPLTFSIQNQPSWATFSSASGQLSGTPSAADAGTYSNIIISVSDGVTSASLAAFTITVNQVSNGSATLTWTPPLQNSDGTTLTNLSGYRIYYGTAANSLTQSIDLGNVGLTSYTISNLSTATWYFGMTAYTSSGTESPLSNMASKTIQ